MNYIYIALVLIFSLQNQSFQIEPKLFLELDNDVLIMFPKWFWSIILSVRTVGVLVFSQNLKFYPELYIALVLMQNQSFQICLKQLVELDKDVLIYLFTFVEQEGYLKRMVSKITQGHIFMLVFIHCMQSIAGTTFTQSLTYTLMDIHKHILDHIHTHIHFA